MQGTGGGCRSTQGVLSLWALWGSSLVSLELMREASWLLSQPELGALVPKPDLASLSPVLDEVVNLLSGPRDWRWLSHLVQLEPTM